MEAKAIKLCSWDKHPAYCLRIGMSCVEVSLYSQWKAKAKTTYELLITWKVVSLTPVGRTRNFFFPSMPVSLTEKISFSIIHQA